MPFQIGLTRKRAIALLAALPPWVTWGQRTGAVIDYDAFFRMNAIVLPDGQTFDSSHCRWCAKHLSGRRTTWCCDEHRDLFYQVAFWSNLCEVIYCRDGGRCRRCRKQVADYYKVDHIVPVRNGGTDDPANLRLVCKPCHVAVGYEQRAAERQQLTLGVA